MDDRLGRTVRVFLAILAVAGFYRLTVVPWVEPRSRATAPGVEMSAEQEQAIRALSAARLAPFKDLFPEGSWELAAPLVFEMGRQMQLLCKDYDILPDGRVRLEQCTILVLPERRSGELQREPGRTYVLRAPQGAILEFDAPPDLKRLTSLPRLIGGSLRGQVTIRGTPTAAGREDDVEIVTRDIELSELEVRSNAAVQFRHGRSRGEGRGLVAVLRPRQNANAGPAPRGHASQGPNIGGIDSIRIDRDVRMRLEGLTGGFLPGAETVGAASSAGQGGGQAETAPVLVTCRGALCLNEPAKVITLEEDVNLVRDLPDDKRDHISCDLLTVSLARNEQQGRLEPVLVIATGTPVVAGSTADGLEACATTLGYDLKNDRIVLSGNDPVSVKFRGNEVIARSIEYRGAAPGMIGRLDASGPGWARLHGESGSAPVAIEWEKSLLVRPDQKQPREQVASIIGAARVSMEGQGTLQGAEMHLWLLMTGTANESATVGRRPAAGPDLSRVRPLRLQVKGNVEAESPAAQASVRTDELRLYFLRPKQRQAEATTAGGGSASDATSPPPLPAVAQPAVAQPAVAQPATHRANRGTMAATAALIVGEISLAATGPRIKQVERLSMKGQVRLVEQPPPNASQPPPADQGIRIEGDEVEVLRPQRFDTHAIVWGKPARVTGQGVELQGPLIEVDRGLNRMKVDGAGRLSGPLGAGGLEGFALAGPPASAPAAGGERITLTWRGRLDFDGRTAQFHEAAVAETRGTRVSADVLEAVLDRSFTFDEQSNRDPPPQLVRFAGAGAVRIDNESPDGEARSVQRLHLLHFVFERPSGDFVGHGPGRLTIVRSGPPPVLTPGGGFASPAAMPPVRPVAVAPAASLTYLGIDFQREVRGNVNRQILEFQQRVEAIHGPVAGWNDALDPRAPRGPGKDQVLIKANQLSVAQGPRQAGLPRGQIDVQAGGNVEVEAESFTGVSNRLTWSEAKDLLVFEGNGLADARIFMQGKGGNPERSLAAEKLLYWRGLNQVELSGMRHVDYAVPDARGVPNGSGSRPSPAPQAPTVPPGT
ncbi:MAG: hypothetical protein ACK6CT_06005 [Planctomycetia bacterium]